MSIDIATVNAERYELKVEIYDGRVIQYVNGLQSGTGTRQVWERRRRLGKGGFGEVWQEHWTDGHGDSHYRAVKICAGDRMREARVDYKRELSALAAFSESQFAGLFVNLRGWWMDSDNLFVAMEYLGRGDLSQYIGPNLYETDAREIVRNVLQGLKVMHNEGFTHRDIKPQNILVVEKRPEFPKWWVKIADFGLSKRTLQDSGTVLRSFLGTIDYLAPEVLDQSSKCVYTNKVDIWSLGCVLYNVSSQGQTPFTARSLWDYHDGRLPFNSQNVDLRLGEKGIILIKALLQPQQEQRPTAAEALGYPWLSDPGGTALGAVAVMQQISLPMRQRNYNSFLNSTNSTIQPLQASVQESQIRSIDSSSHEGAMMSSSSDRGTLTSYASDTLDKSMPDTTPISQDALHGQAEKEPAWGVAEQADTVAMTTGSDLGVLVSRQARPSIATSFPEDIASPHNTAVRSQDETLDVVEWLESNKDSNLSLLVLAVINGRLDVVMWLAERGTSIHEKNYDGWTPLHTAASHGHLDVVGWLVERGASIDEKNNNGWTPLHNAASNGHLDVVGWLVERGASVDEKDIDSWTPLYVAASDGHLDMVRWLVERGASVEKTDGMGRTPVQIAKKYGKEDVVVWLTRHSARLPAPRTRWYHRLQKNSDGQSR